MNRGKSVDLGRREFLGSVALGVTALAGWNACGAEPPPGAEKHMAASRAVLLSETGGDRATGYVMSNKIARRRGNLVATWIDSARQNRWAEVDAQTLRIVRSGPVGAAGVDNHCGAAIATDVDGMLHLIVGAHHGPFTHYGMPLEADDWELADGGREVATTATYPSVVCDSKGSLHLIYRYEPGGRDAQLFYCRRPRGGRWSTPRSLFKNAVSEHSWLTNAIDAGPDGRLHILVSNTLPVPEAGPAARYYGASHLYSDDAGETWRQFGSPQSLELPLPGREARRIEGDGMQPDRIEREYGGPRGPQHSYYHKILLSNPVADERGRPWVVVHNLLEGTADLCRYEEGTGWVATALREAVRSVLPNFSIQHSGQLSRHRDGTIEVVLMVAPRHEHGWGTPGTELVRLLIDATGAVRRAELARSPQPSVPHWLPSIERWCWHSPVERPALLFTRGLNAGGYDQNRNSVNTEVWLQIPGADDE